MTAALTEHIGWALSMTLPAGGGVAGVADGDVAGKLGDVLFLERLPDKPHGDLDVDAVAGAGGDARALLPAVLECVEAEEGVCRATSSPSEYMPTMPQASRG